MLRLATDRQSSHVRSAQTIGGDSRLPVEIARIGEMRSNADQHIKCAYDGILTGDEQHHLSNHRQDGSENENRERMPSNGDERIRQWQSRPARQRRDRRQQIGCAKYVEQSCHRQECLVKASQYGRQAERNINIPPGKHYPEHRDE